MDENEDYWDLNNEFNRSTRTKRYDKESNTYGICF
jgi:hypothetical protein